MSLLGQELLVCIKRRNFDRARELVEIHRVNINFSDEKGYTPLILAARFQRIHIVRFLLENDANVDAANNEGETALIWAVWLKNVALAQLLLEHDANTEIIFREQPASLYSPIGYAIDTSKAEMVAQLLRFGANTAETVCHGFKSSALYIACWKSSVEIVQLLLDHEDGVDINAFEPREGDAAALSPLCCAVWRRNMEMTQLLVQHGARVIFDGGVYPDVPCPLVYAARWCSLELVRFLFDHLPEVVEVNNHPLSPVLEIAIQYNKVDVAQLLVDRGANVNDRPFLYKCAMFEQRVEVARLLLRSGADVNLANNEESGETPLWAAAKNGRVKLVQELLKARANVRIRDNSGGETPLGVAFRRGHKSVVYLLLRTSPHVWPKLARYLIGEE